MFKFYLKYLNNTNIITIKILNFLDLTALNLKLYIYTFQIQILIFPQTYELIFL